MWNPREHLDDLIAVGHTEEEAIAETRQYAAERRAIQARATKEAAQRRERKGDGGRSMYLVHKNRKQRVHEQRQASGQPRAKEGGA